MSVSARPLDWLRLTKPGIVLSNALMAAAGAALAPLADAETVGLAVVGTAGLVAGCGASNMVMERRTDRRMARTATRPVADRRVAPGTAASFGLALVAVGAVLLAQTTFVALGLGLLATLVYLAVYTPMKRVTWWAIPVGAFAGALPPVIGWTAAGGGPSIVPALLFALVYLWQIPHFIAIGVRRHADYEAAGLRIGIAPGARRGAVRATRVLSATMLVLTCALGALMSASWLFWALAGSGAGLMTAVSFRGAARSTPWSRRLFLASLVYLPLFAAALFLA